MAEEPEKQTIKRLHRNDVEWLYNIVLRSIAKAHDDFLIHGKTDAFEEVATKIVGMVDEIVDGVANKYEKNI